jgi:predicted HTH transcriptional regulator
MSRKKLSEVIGDISEDGVKNYLEKLKEDGRIERIGGTRGKWKVMG